MNPKEKLFFILFFISAVWITDGQDFYQEGLRFYQNKQYKQAENQFSKNLNKHPGHLPTLEYLGDIAVYYKHWDQAIMFYEKLLEAKYDDGNYHFKYGGAIGLKALHTPKYKALFMIDDIKEHFTKAVTYDTTHIEGHWGLVELYVNLPGIIGGSTDKAYMYADRLHRLSEVDGLLARGYIERKDHNVEEAKKLYIEAARVGMALHTYTNTDSGLQVTESRYTVNRNQLHYQIGKVCAEYKVHSEKGLAHLNYFIKHNSIKDHISLEWAYYQKAQILLRQSKIPKARTALQKALKLEPEFKEAKQLLQSLPK